MLCFGFTAVYKSEKDTVKEFITGEKKYKSQAPKTLLCDGFFTAEFHVGLPSQQVSFILALKNLSDQTPKQAQQRLPNCSRIQLQWLSFKS